jgi:hypothetical protein
MAYFSTFISDLYNKKSVPLTGEAVSKHDLNRLARLEDIVPVELQTPVITSFILLIDGIETEKRQYKTNGTQYATKWTQIIPLLERIVDEYFIVRNHFPSELKDYQIVSRLTDFHMSTYTKTPNRLSHPFICGKGEVEKAVRLSEILTRLPRANKGYLISIGAIIGLLGNELKDLNTKVFLDYCKKADIEFVEANTIDDAQLKQVSEYGKSLGIKVLEWLEDGAKTKFGSTDKSVAIVDGYSIRFQTADFVNRFKRYNPNSDLVVTITKPKHTRTSISLATKIDDFVGTCKYPCKVVPYGNSEEEALVVVSKHNIGTFDKITIPHYTYSDKVMQIFCNSFG